jgi:nucleoid DNA-binding protein
MPKNSPTRIRTEETKMIKTDLVRNIADKMNIHTKDAESFLTTFTDIASDCLASGGPVRLAGFGTFDVRHVAEHQAGIPV